MSKYFCELLISNKLILPEDREVYEYGFKEFQIIVFFTIIFLSIGFVKNYLLDALIFLFSFIVLRAYYPGIHSKSKVIADTQANVYGELVVSDVALELAGRNSISQAISCILKDF